MKLKYQITKKTTLESQIIKDNIISQLKQSNYIVENITENTVNFNDNGWGLTGNKANKMNSGVFKIIGIGNDKTIVLTFYMDIMYNLLFLGAAFLLTFFEGYEMLVFAGVVILITLISLSLTKTRAKETLDQIG